jgi:cobalt/nickel transport system permease protein
MGAGHAHALYVHEHSFVHRLPPQVKVASALSFVFLVAITPREAVWGFLIYAAAIAVVAISSRISPGFLALRMLGIIPFVAFAFLIPFIASGQQIEVLGVGVSREGLWAAWNILAKASIGAATSVVLAATTEVPDILAGMNRLQVPVVLTSIAGFMIRYLELIVEEIGRIRVAMASRGYDPRWLWQARPIAASAGAMFVRSYERGERVYDAMVARGFSGEMPELRRRDPSARDWLSGAMLPVLGLLVSVIGVVAT